MIKSLLITEDSPTENYGTGQRVKLWRDAMNQMGECRILHLVPPGETGCADYSAPIVFDHRAGRTKWLWWQATFGYYRSSPRYAAILKRIHVEFPFDVAVCSFFRTTAAAPLNLTPCMLDVDALPRPAGKLDRLLWPITTRMMRRRARRFDPVVVISKAEGAMIEGRSLSTELLPGASISVRACLAPDAPRGRNILFVGPMDWAPNRDVVEWLLGIGLPERLHEAGYVLRLVGKGTDGFGNRPGLSTGGFVDDLAKEYADATIVLCPIEVGAGANIKLAEAIQYGCAVMASPYSLSAYDGILTPGVHVLTYPDRAGFDDLLMAALADETRLVEYRRRAAEVAQGELDIKRLKEKIGAWIVRAAARKVAA